MFQVKSRWTRIHAIKTINNGMFYKHFGEGQSCSSRPRTIARTNAFLVLFCMLVHTGLLILGWAALSGLAGLSMFGASLKRSAGRATQVLVGVPMIIVFMLVGAQMGWTLRPYLVRPRTPGVVFIRQIEGSLLDAVVVAIDSSQGKYYRGFVPSKRGAPSQPIEPPQ